MGKQFRFRILFGATLLLLAILSSIGAYAKETSWVDSVATTEEPTEEPPAVFHDVEVKGFVGWARPNPNHIFALPLRSNDVRTMQLGVQVKNNSDHNETFNLTLTIDDVVSGCGTTVITSPTTISVNLAMGEATTKHFSVAFLCEPVGVIQNAVVFHAQATHLGAADQVPGNNGKFAEIDVFVRGAP